MSDKKLSFAEIRQAIETAPQTYLPALFMTMVESCLEAKVFQPGGMKRIVEKVEPKEQALPPPPQTELRARLNDICHAINERLPEGQTFIVFTASIGENGTLNYASNMDRKTAINVLKEWMIKAGSGEDWMKHL